MINKLISRAIPYLPEKLIWMFSKKYIAGETAEDALRVVRELNAGNIMVTIDVLGELIETKEKALAYTEQYLDIIGEASRLKLRTSFSLKPSMFGLLWNTELCYLLIRRIVDRAYNSGYFVRIDMEDARCTQLELTLFERLYNEFGKQIGIVLQACLKRTIHDLVYLKSISKEENPVNIRLCKGIYIEHPSIAYKGKEEIRNNFQRCLEYMLVNNLFPAIATHDKELINRSLSLLERYKKSYNDYEFQMLYGVAPRLRSLLVAKGHTMRVYVPFGKQWFRYSTRRLQENPRMIRDILMALFIKQ
jgi:proline dehydrogenase